MNNAEPQKNEQPNESNWKEMPLFRQIVATPVINAAPQISNRLPEENFAAELLPEINAAPQNRLDAFVADAAPLIAESPVVEDAAPHLTENAAPDKKQEKEDAALLSFENAVPHKINEAEETEKAEEIENVEKAGKMKTGKKTKSPPSPKPARRKKPRPKSSKKKIRSQKRIAEPIKMFASPAEKAVLESKAERSGRSLSNYLRLQCGLPLNEAGRKKTKDNGGIQSG